MTKTNAYLTVSAASSVTTIATTRADPCRVDGRDCSDVSCRASGCQMAFLEERNARLEVALCQIAQLIDAFPLDGALSAGDISLITGVGTIARRALMIDLREMQHA